MKWLITVLVALSLTATLSAQAPVKLGYNASQPNGATGIMVWKLAPSKACTTAGHEIGGWGGASLQIADSVSAEGKVAIIKVRFQVANYDANKFYNATGVGDSIPVKADTLTGGATAALRWKYSRIYDFSAQIPRAKMIRFIISNSGTDTCNAISIYPLFNTSTP